MPNIIDTIITTQNETREKVFSALNTEFKTNQQLGAGAANSEGKTPTIVATENSCLYAMEWLLNEKMHPGSSIDIDHVDHHKKSAMVYAISHKDLDHFSEEKLSLEDTILLQKKRAIIDLLVKIRAYETKAQRVPIITPAIDSANLYFLNKFPYSLYPRYSATLLERALIHDQPYFLTFLKQKKLFKEAVEWSREDKLINLALEKKDLTNAQRCQLIATIYKIFHIKVDISKNTFISALKNEKTPEDQFKLLQTLTHHHNITIAGAADFIFATRDTKLIELIVRKFEHDYESNFLDAVKYGEINTIKLLLSLNIYYPKTTYEYDQHANQYDIIRVKNYLAAYDAIMATSNPRRTSALSNAKKILSEMDPHDADEVLALCSSHISAEHFTELEKCIPTTHVVTFHDEDVPSYTKTVSLFSKKVRNQELFEGKTHKLI